MTTLEIAAALDAAVKNWHNITPGNRKLIAQAAKALRATLAEGDRLRAENERLSSILKRSKLPIDHAADAASWEQQYNDARKMLEQVIAENDELRSENSMLVQEIGFYRK